MPAGHTRPSQWRTTDDDDPLWAAVTDAWAATLATAAHTVGEPDFAASVIAWPTHDLLAVYDRYIAPGPLAAQYILVTDSEPAPSRTDPDDEFDAFFTRLLTDADAGTPDDIEEAETELETELAARGIPVPGRVLTDEERTRLFDPQRYAHPSYDPFTGTNPDDREPVEDDPDENDD